MALSMSVPFLGLISTCDICMGDERLDERHERPALDDAKEAALRGRRRPHEHRPAALAAAAETLELFAAHKAAYERSLAPVAIDPAYGYEYALCCGYGCDPDNCTCECANLPI